MPTGIPFTSRPATRYSLLLALVVALGTWVRVAHFPAIPPGLNQDEAASAYEAFSLALTGLDKWGTPWPAYFPAWGSGQNVLLAYLTVPVVKLFGLNVFTARVVMLALGLGTLPLLAWCLRPAGRFVALLATLTLAVAPWHFMLSRWALESNALPFFMLLGCGLLARALSTGQRRWIVPALLPFALSLYAYGTTAVVLPPLLGLVLALAWRQVRAQWGAWLLSLGLFAVVALPFGIFFAENYLAHHNFAWTDHLFFATPLLIASRAGQVSGGSLAATLATNFRFLLSGCDDGTVYNLLPGYKLLLSTTLPLALLGALLGAWQLAQRRSRLLATPAGAVLTVLAAWGLASFVLFCTIELNVNRFNHFYVPCIALAAWAVAVVVRNFQPTVPRALVRAGVLAWTLTAGGLAVYQYFSTYPSGAIREQFSAGLGEAFAALDGLWGTGQVRITDRLPLPYIYTLFYTRYPPAQFQREAQVRIVGGAYEVRRFGRFVFTPEELANPHAYAYLSRRDEYPDTPEQHRQVIFTNDLWEVGLMQPGPRP
jgi:4-amino-4-deoxy-L-arabinose transferase-like glycosyltransferase